MSIGLLPPEDDRVPFPPVHTAAREPNGLLAVGGNLGPRRLLDAYCQGIFPWFGDGEPILWWAPDPRCVLFPQRLHIARSLRRTLNRGHLRVTRNAAFAQVLRGCAEPRAGSPGTWIVPSMQAAYTRLYELGYAISFECWQGQDLVGGIYGVHLGAVFFGESMFSRVPDASKVALVETASAEDIALIDCQLSSDHLLRMGAQDIPREQFLELLRRHGASRTEPGPSDGATAGGAGGYPDVGVTNG